MSMRRSARLSASASSVAAPSPQPASTKKRKSSAAATDKSSKAEKPVVASKARAGKKRKVDHPGQDDANPLGSAVSAKSSGDAQKQVALSSGHVDNATPPPAVRGPTRPILPHMTNAPLVTPRGSRVIPNLGAVNGDAPVSPTKIRPGQVTTDNLLDTACAHLLKVDPKLKTVIDQHYCNVFSPEGLAEEIDPFRSLASGIMGQQVSGAAAKSIKNKFVALFPPDDHGNPKFPGPKEVSETKIERLRLAGLSQRKAEYIQGLAEKFASGELTAQMLAEASDEEILAKLTAVRGLGPWSVEMFAFFALKRTDIFSTGDLGVQRGMAAYMGRDVAKLKAKGGKWKYMSEKDMLDISARFSPYRSLFMWYMWRIEDVDVSVLADS